MTTYFLSLGAGALTALSPCILPLLPIMAGSSMAKRKSGPLFIALGMVLSLVIMGLVFSSLKTLLGLREDTVRLISAILLLTFGIVLLFPKLKEKISAPFDKLGNFAMQKSSIININNRLGQFLIGFLVGAAWSPCIGPTLGIAMGLAGTQDGLSEATMMMTLFGIGLSFPLLLIAYGLREFIQSRRNLFAKVNQMGMKIMGGAIVFIGLLMITGMDKAMEANVASNMPPWILQISSYL